MGILDNFKNLLNISPEEDDDIGENMEFADDNDLYESEPAAKKREPVQRSFADKRKVVSYNAPASQMQVVLVKPERYEDVKDIADHLNAKKTVVLNLEASNKENARRIIDFLSGATYANHGTVKKIANSTFLLAPANVDFSGEMMLDEFEDNKIYF